MVFANKTDVNGCMDEEEILEVSGLPSLPGSVNRLMTRHLQALQLKAIRTHRWHILRCSAVTGSNLEEGLAWVVEDAKKRLFLY